MQADAIHQWQLRWPHPTPQLWCLRWLAHPAAGTVTPGHVARQNPYSQYATGMHVASIASSSSSSRGKLQQCAATGAWPYNGQRPPCRALPPPFAVLRRHGLCVRHPQCTPSSLPPPPPPQFSRARIVSADYSCNAVGSQPSTRSRGSLPSYPEDTTAARCCLRQCFGDAA